MDESISSSSGKVTGFTKAQEAKNIACKNSTTYEINWKYKTNLSGDAVSIFTGKQIEGFNKKKESSPIVAGDVVKFKRNDHPNNGLKATVKRVLKPLSDAEMAEQGKDIRQTTKFPPVYTLEFLKSPYSKEEQVSSLKTSKIDEMQKIVNFKSKLCVNWRKEALLKHLKKENIDSLQEREKKRNEYNTKPREQYFEGLEKDAILINKIQSEMKKIFMRNKKFTPDSISAWESNSYQEYNKDELIPPDGTYYIMNVEYLEKKEKILTNKEVCDKNPPYYKLWVTVKVILRKEAQDIGSDILFNGKLFLGCDKKKQTILNILNEIKNDALSTTKKLATKAGIPQPKDTSKDECNYLDSKINESDIKQDIDVIQGFLKNQKVMVASKDFKWEGMVPGKITNINKNPVTYDIMLDSNVMLRKVETNYIKPVDDDMAGGKQKRYRKTKRRRRKKRRKTKRRRRKK